MIKFINFIILTFTFFIININFVFAKKFEELLKLYDLYSQDILNIDQLNVSLERIDLNNENIKNIISLRKSGIISEDDFISGIKKIIQSSSMDENNLIENQNATIISNSKKYNFQSELTNIHAYVISDFNYGEIWNHEFIIIDDKISEITLKDSEKIDILKFSKAKFKLLKDNKFSIRSSVTYLPDPSVGIRYDFKGKFTNNKVVGEAIITYTGSDAPGTVLLKSKTN